MRRCAAAGRGSPERRRTQQCAAAMTRQRRCGQWRRLVRPPRPPARPAGATLRRCCALLERRMRSAAAARRRSRSSRCGRLGGPARAAATCGGAVVRVPHAVCETRCQPSRSKAQDGAVWNRAISPCCSLLLCHAWGMHGSHDATADRWPTDCKLWHAAEASAAWALASLLNAIELEQTQLVQCCKTESTAGHTWFRDSRSPGHGFGRGDAGRA